MLKYNELNVNDSVRVVDDVGLYSFAKNGDILKVIEVGANYARLRNKEGGIARFSNECGLAHIAKI